MRLVDYTLRHLIFEITIKSLVFTVFYFKISEITPAMLCCKRTLLHGHAKHHVFLFLFQIVTYMASSVVTILVLKRAFRCIIRNLAHAF